MVIYNLEDIYRNIIMPDAFKTCILNSNAFLIKLLHIVFKFQSFMQTLEMLTSNNYGFTKLNVTLQIT